MTSPFVLSKVWGGGCRGQRWATFWTPSLPPSFPFPFWTGGPLCQKASLEPKWVTVGPPFHSCPLRSPRPPCQFCQLSVAPLNSRDLPASEGGGVSQGVLPAPPPVFSRSPAAQSLVPWNRAGGRGERPPSALLARPALGKTSGGGGVAWAGGEPWWGGWGDLGQSQEELQGPCWKRGMHRACPAVAMQNDTHKTAHWGGRGLGGPGSHPTPPHRDAQRWLQRELNKRHH